MIPDPTDEIRSIRNRLAAACNYDIDLIVEEARRHQAESGRTFINLPSRPVESYTPPLSQNGELIDAKLVNHTLSPGGG